MAHYPTRRDIVLAGAALSVAGGPAYAETPAATPKQPYTATASGTVAEIVSGATAPLKDVLVSNGREVVRTDDQGRFSLPVTPGQAIFVIKPSGFRLPLDAKTNLPRFAYVHDPDGTPAALKFRYAGLPPSGPLPASIDFHLTRAPEPDAFDVILTTDTQPESTAEIEYVRDDLVAGLIGTKAAFGINCGDIAFDDLSMYGRINRIIGRIGVPWWNIGGNHDLDFEAPTADRSRDTYKRVFGATYYAHEHGNALFVMLDNVDYFGAAHKLAQPEPHYRGHFSPDQLTFVENLLAATPKDRLVVFCMHIPLQTYLGTDPSRRTVNAADLLKLIGDRPSVSFAGHTHSTEHHYFGAAEGFTGATPHHHHVLTAVSGAWWSGPRDHRGIASADSYDGTPHGYHILSIANATYETRYVAAAEPAGRQMRISLETQFHQDEPQVELAVPMIELLRSPIAVEQAAGTMVVVNVFDGGPRTRVVYTLDGLSPTVTGTESADASASGGGRTYAMDRVSRPDPFIVQVFGRNRETIKKWVTPQISSHLWAAALPPGLDAGAYALRVTATDEYGRRHTESMVLEIV